MLLKNKDLLGLEGVSAEEISHILESAESMKAFLKQGVKKMPQLQNKSIVTLFYENSTRTKMSFDLAGKYLGASMSAIAASSSSIQKGETLLDTGRTLEAMGIDIVIMRHPMSGAPELLGAQYLGGGHQCRRRDARAPDASAFGYVYDERKTGQD